MINRSRLLIVLLLIITSSAFAQKFKKADRVIAQNIESHIHFLADAKQPGHTAGLDREQLAHQYIAGELRKSGCKPMGDSSSWMQKFNIADGKEIVNSSSFSINGKPLVLGKEFFPFAFSGSNKVEASVAMALAETGVPWFVELKELLDDNEDSSRMKDTSYMVCTRAKRAVSKGATALVIYNNSIIRDISFNALDSSAEAKIPVIYISSTGVRKHIGKDPSILDLKMNIAMKDRFLEGINVIGYQDNHADSSVIISSHLGDEKDVAALIELSRVLKARTYRSFNYLFIVYSGEERDAHGINYFSHHPVINLHHVNHTLNLGEMQDKGLPAVKESLTVINALKRK